jgi:hypothetical protein
MRMNVAAIRDHTGREREDASFTPHQRDGRRLLSSHRSPFHLLRSGFRRHMIQTSLAADRKGVMRYPWLAAVAFLLSADIADAMTYKDIAGQWCGEITDYVFAPNSLSVKFHDSRPAETFKITKYTYNDDDVRIDWLNSAGKDAVTVFTEFIGNGTMVQQQNDRGPRRSFKRR